MQLPAPAEMPPALDRCFKSRRRRSVRPTAHSRTARPSSSRGREVADVTAAAGQSTHGSPTTSGPACAAASSRLRVVVGGIVKSMPARLGERAEVLTSGAQQVQVAWDLGRHRHAPQERRGRARRPDRLAARGDGGGQVDAVARARIGLGQQRRRDVDAVAEPRDQPSAQHRGLGRRRPRRRAGGHRGARRAAPPRRRSSGAGRPGSGHRSIGTWPNCGRGRATCVPASSTGPSGSNRRKARGCWGESADLAQHLGQTRQTR